MDLIRRAHHWALGRPRVLLVHAPDEQQGRWAVEAELDRRGWPPALSPADTDLLLVVGHPGPQLAEAVEVLWSQVPWPRHRTSWSGHVALPEALDTAAQELADVVEHGPRHDLHRPDPQTLLSARADGLASDAGTADHGHDSDDSSGGQGGSVHGDGHAMAHGGEDDGEHTGHDEHSDNLDGEHAPPHAAHDESSGHAVHASDGQPGGHDEHAEHAGHGQHAGHGEHGGQPGGATDEGMDHEGMHHGGEDHSQHGSHGEHGDGADDGGMDHGGHGGHGGMDVAGLPMAETAPDRDGLQLDELKVSLGPVLPGWPTGLVLEAGLQGDVLTGVELRWLDEEDPGSHVPETAEREPRMALDVLADLLLVAGWARVAVAARRARDGLGSADPAEVEAARREADRLARRVRRSRTLAWNLRGLGSLQGTDGRETDLLGRIHSWCAVAAGDRTTSISTPALSDLAGGLEGAELGAVRLVVASLGLSRAVGRPHEVAGV